MAILKPNFPQLKAIYGKSLLKTTAFWTMATFLSPKSGRLTVIVLYGAFMLLVQEKALII